MVLWAWFIAATFNTVELTFLQSIGIVVMVGLVTKHTKINTDEDFDDIGSFLNEISTSFVRPLLALLFGFLAHMFM